MKQFFVVFLLCFIAVIFIGSLGTKSPVIIPTPSPSIPIPTEPVPPPEVEFRNLQYAYRMITVLPGTRVRLIPNYRQKKTLAILVEQNRCSGAINAGFYDTSGNPLGLVIADGVTVSGTMQSSLLNGFFFIGQGGIASIGSDPPDHAADIAIQSGPLLIASGIPASLHIRDDEEARRSIVALTPDKNIVLISIYKNDAAFSGPLLADLPQVLMLIATGNSIRFASALNLDGGGASAFFDGVNSVSELTTVGGIFCIDDH